MKRLFLVTASVCSLAGTAQASTIGAYVEGGLWGSDTQGGMEQNYAQVSGTSPDAYSAEATFNTDELTPILRAAATNTAPYNSDEYIAGRAYAYQTYQYTGAGSTTLTIDLALHGIIDRVYSSSYIDATFMAYRGTDLSDSYCAGKTRLEGFNQYACNGILAEGFSYSFIELATSGEQTLNSQVSFNVNSGDTFMIYAGLEAITFGGSVDATHTLTAKFTDLTNLVALGQMPSPPASVPEPATAGLMLSGLLGVVGAARRRKKRA